MWPRAEKSVVVWTVTWSHIRVCCSEWHSSAVVLQVPLLQLPCSVGQWREKVQLSQSSLPKGRKETFFYIYIWIKVWATLMARISTGYLCADLWEGFECSFLCVWKQMKISTLWMVVDMVSEMVELQSQGSGSLFYAIFLYCNVRCEEFCVSSTVPVLFLVSLFTTLLCRNSLIPCHFQSPNLTSLIKELGIMVAYISSGILFTQLLS